MTIFENYAKPLRSKTSTIDIYIKLAQYPILSDAIRKKMRETLFMRGIITRALFEKEVEEMAIESQKREGVHDPFNPEPVSVWQERKARIRNFHTDYYFAYNLPPEDFDQIISSVIDSGRNKEKPSMRLSFNPELAPWEMLFEQGTAFEKLPPPELAKVQHHLEEIKVVLIRGMITDQLPLIAVAKRALSIADLMRVHKRRVGEGKIGGKAAGMLIAWKILQQQDPSSGADVSGQVAIPESYYLGTNVMYEFRRYNALDDSMNQKYKPLDQVRDDYERVVDVHLAGTMPSRIVEQLREVLENIGDKPVIVRSSSLLEDNFGSAFAGKYDSYFCPNQRSPEENLSDLLDAIKRVYASSLNPDALLYRQQHGLIDYDERMAILIQEVKGERFGDYFFPTLAGVGFSHNPFRWNPKIRREEGFLRMVWGMGTRAVDRVSADYPRLISLSHPTLRPETTAKAITQYSQRSIDLINLKTNTFETLPVGDVLTPYYRYLRYLSSENAGGYMQELVSAASIDDVDDLVLTFDYLTKDKKFVTLMRTALMRIEEAYGAPVDTEFAIEIVPSYPYPDYKLNLLQCRPLSQRQEGGAVEIPADLSAESILFTEHELVPNGKVEGIRYIVFVDPQRYRQVPDMTTKIELGRVVGRLNKILEKEQFILMGPGRWGSSNIDLGVKVSYADIYNTKILVEVAVEMSDGAMPELSYGTHFFQDLVEAGIYSLPLHLDRAKARFAWDFFRKSTNLLGQFSPDDAEFSDYIRVIDVVSERSGQRLNVFMDGENDEAVGFLVQAEGWDNRPQDDGTVSIPN